MAVLNLFKECQQLAIASFIVLAVHLEIARWLTVPSI